MTRIIPPTRLFIAAIAMVAGLSACSGPAVLSCWNSLDGANHRPRVAPHAGVDIRARRGTPALAAMDGTVAWVGETVDGCGKGIALRHEVASRGGNRFTLYCHLQVVDVVAGQSVRRGETIGRVGTTGKAVGVPHVHFEISADPRSHADGDLRGTEDPRPYFTGCFDPKDSYPATEFALTYPVRCTTAPRLEC